MSKQQNSFLIRNIAQTDAWRFTVLWTDQKKQTFRLSTLQASCPCARCSKQRNEGVLTKVDPQVSANTVSSVGRYALKISFTSGCSYGIYPFSLLRELAEEENEPNS